MHVLSAVFIDGARMLSRGSIVDALQGIPALIKERMKLNPHTNVQKQIFSKKTSKGKKNGTVSCMEKSENGGYMSQNVSLYICYINYSDNLSFHCSRDLDVS